MTPCDRKIFVVTVIVLAVPRCHCCRLFSHNLCLSFVSFLRLKKRNLLLLFLGFMFYAFVDCVFVSNFFSLLSFIVLYISLRVHFYAVYYSCCCYFFLFIHCPLPFSFLRCWRSPVLCDSLTNMHTCSFDVVSILFLSRSFDAYNNSMQTIYTI